MGLDFGTLSVRALLLDVETGEEICCAESEYAHGVMERELPDGTPLGFEWALQHPQDYMESMVQSVHTVLRESAVSPQQVLGIGVDFTSCTMLPVLDDGTPLCCLKEYESRAHAYVKLWKHHAAQYCADRLNELAEKTKQPFLKRYGGKISCEWMVPKAMQIAQEDPGIYAAAGRLIEAGDWVVWQLCGKESRSACQAGYKALWNDREGFPSEEFFTALHPLLSDLTRKKLGARHDPIGTKAGGLSAGMAARLGLCEATPVATAIIDAHASVASCGIADSGKMLMIMGTSTCHMMLSEQEVMVPGICGVVRGGILPGFYGYEAGQSCVGDHFSWFLKNCLPEHCVRQAQQQGIGLHELMRRRLAGKKPGQTGLLALDWWNGVRSPLMNFDLSGVMMGMTLATQPEDMYMALLEATAYGTRSIIDAFEKGGVPVRELYAAGGIAAKDPLMMQIYADVTGRTIRLSGSSQSGARGAAILALGAAGPAAAGYSSLLDAVSALGRLSGVQYIPKPENTAVYEQLYALYSRMQSLLGEEHSYLMKTLRALRTQ